MSLTENSSTRRFQFNVSHLMRYLPVVIIVGLWCIFESNLFIEIHDQIMMRITFSALVIVLSSFVLRDGDENLGLYSLTIGVCIYFGSFIVTSGLPLVLLLDYETRAILALLNTIGASISLFGAVSLSLWLSNTRLNHEQKEVKYGAPILTVILVLVWIGVEASLILPGTFLATLPGVELLFYIGLIMTTSIFIPRRQLISIFFFTVGLCITLGGLLILTRAASLDAFLLGFSLRISGTILLILFALPLSASSTSYKAIPESGLYITAVTWFFLEILYGGSLFPFSVFRVLAMVIIIILALRGLRISSFTNMMIGMIVGAELAIIGFYMYTMAYLLPMKSTLEYAGLALTIASITLCMFCTLSLGESIRLKIKDNRNATFGMGLILILAGLACGISALFLPLFYFSMDILFLILTGLGSMLILIKPRKTLNYIFIIATLFAGSIVFTGFLITVQFFYYSALTIMIFSCVQQFRIHPTRHVENSDEPVASNE